MIMADFLIAPPRTLTQRSIRAPGQQLADGRDELGRPGDGSGERAGLHQTAEYRRPSDDLTIADEALQPERIVLQQAGHRLGRSGLEDQHRAAPVGRPAGHQRRSEAFEELPVSGPGRLLGVDVTGVLVAGDEGRLDGLQILAGRRLYPSGGPGGARPEPGDAVNPWRTVGGR